MEQLLIGGVIRHETRGGRSCARREAQRKVQVADDR